MYFDFTDDQKTFYTHTRDMFRKECDVDKLRATWESGTGRIPGLWEVLAENGLLGALAPEEAGGLGFTDLDMVRLFEAAGEVALPDPLIEHAAVAVPLLAACRTDKAKSVLQKAIEGRVTLTTNLGSPNLVTASSTAHGFVIADEPVDDDARIWLVPRKKALLAHEESVDKSRDVANCGFQLDDAYLLAEGDEAEQILAQARLRGTLATAAFLNGLATAMTKLSVEYTSVRRQFGKPIGSFQAVQHRIVNGYIKQQFAKPVVYQAAYALSHGEDDAAMRVSMAKVFASEAADRVAREALQVHGGIGYTTEYELHLWMKRAWTLNATWGTARHHRRKVETHLLGEFKPLYTY